MPHKASVMFFYPAHRNTRQIHLDQSFLDRGLAPPVAFDDRRLEGLAPELRHLQRHLAGLGLEAALIMPRPRVAPGIAAFVSLCVAEPVGFRIEQRVERLLNRAAHDPVQVTLDPFVIDPDHVVERPWNRRILTHGGFLLWFSSWLRNHHLSPSRGRQPSSNCAKLSVRHPRSIGRRWRTGSASPPSSWRPCMSGSSRS